MGTSHWHANDNSGASRTTVMQLPFHSSSVFNFDSRKSPETLELRCLDQVSIHSCHAAAAAAAVAVYKTVSPTGGLLPTCIIFDIHISACLYQPLGLLYLAFDGSNMQRGFSPLISLVDLLVERGATFPQ